MKAKPEDAFRKGNVADIKKVKSAEKKADYDRIAETYTRRLNHALAAYQANLQHTGPLKVTKAAKDEQNRRQEAVKTFMSMYNGYVDDATLAHSEKFNAQTPIQTDKEAESILKKLTKGKLTFSVSVTDRLGGEGSVTIINDSNFQPITPLKLADLSEVSRQARLRKAETQKKVQEANAALGAEQ